MNKPNLIRRNRYAIYRGKYSPTILLWLISLVTILFVFNSCKKDNHNPDIPQGEKNLIVEFGTATIPVSAADSGYVIFKRVGTGIQTLQRFDKEGSFFKMDIGSLSSGEWTAYIYLYAGVPNTVQKREYFQSKKFTLTKAAAEIKLAAPAGTHEDAWERRAHFNSGTDLNAFISMDSENPYFRVNISDKSKWSYFAIFRSAYKKGPGGKELLADAGWECYADCFNNSTVFENSTHFIPFANQAKGKPWNYGEIEFMAIDKDNNEKDYFLPYNK